jgi:hypothetical protein
MANPGKNSGPLLSKLKGLRGMAQVVECEAVSSVPSTEKEKKKKRTSKCIMDLNIKQNYKA